MCQYNPFELSKAAGDVTGGVTNIRPEEPRRNLENNVGLIAVSYEARARGVKRGMRGVDARKVCPEIQVVQVPTSHGKSDLQIYRDAGAEVLAVLMRAATATERASIDEAYLDITRDAARLLQRRGLTACVRLAADTHVAGAGDDDPEARLGRRAVRLGHRPVGQGAQGLAAEEGDEDGAEARAGGDPSPARRGAPREAWGAEEEGEEGGEGVGFGDDDGDRAEGGFWGFGDAPQSPLRASAGPSPLQPPQPPAAAAAADGRRSPLPPRAPPPEPPPIEELAAGDGPPVTSSVRRRGGAFSQAWLERPEYLWSEHEKLLVAGAAVVAGAPPRPSV